MSTVLNYSEYTSLEFNVISIGNFIGNYREILYLCKCNIIH